ncbi:iron-siderophore ABC transporter substrate-binding protein [Occultella aeris]|uniref:Fe(3+)-citrate-binding protein YfmC n=1 Tax=Occultella aeris TaxID=2761496 RepID=A0A7M4DQC3_9MICO|nr:iron-siderophore ABC transporter substrate-binding protein [Occultella aeris]VZO39667.1 Fe(3+)-citrate-binding protein YfmC precursor [Occultella aeris]
MTTNNVRGHRRRLPAIVATVIATALTLTACGGGSDAASDDDAATAGAADDGSFPVTIEHAFGETTLEEVPERVVTLGWSTHDIVAALGVVPVGVPETWGGDDEGYSEWFRDQVEDEIGGALPEILNYDDSGELDFEQVLALAPDVIIAPVWGVDEVSYDRLSEIAPTVAHLDPENSWSSTWQDLTVMVGEVLGRSDAAGELVAQTETLLDDATQAHPEFAGASFVYGLTLSDGATELGLYIPDDPRVRLLRELGFVDTPAMQTVLDSVEGGNWYGGVSLEELDTVEADLFLAWSAGPEELAYTLEHPTFSRWAPIASGHYLFFEDEALAMATNGPSPLSIEWALANGFVDKLADALAGGAVTVS